MEYPCKYYCKSHMICISCKKKLTEENPEPNEVVIMNTSSDSDKSSIKEEREESLNSLHLRE